jgi:hypothetical protein
MTKETLQSSKIAWWQRTARRVMEPVFSIVFPGEVHDPDHNLDKARQLQDKGMALIVCYGHPTKREGLDGPTKVITRYLHDQRIVIPIAAHQYNKWLGNLGLLTGTDIDPIVIKDTINTPGFENRKLGEGGPLYIEHAGNMLLHGGDVWVAPQVGRKPSIGYITDPENVAIATLLLKTAKNNKIRVEDIKAAILPVGIDIRGVTDFNNYNEFNWGRWYRYMIGEPKLLSEVLENAGGVKKIDQEVFRMIAEVSPPGYVDSDFARR